MIRPNRQRLAMLLVVPVLVCLVFGSLFVGTRFSRGPQAAHATAPQVVTAQDLQALFFVWASGTTAVQQLAARDCAQLALSTGQCATVSGAVRATWLALADRDPAAVGRPEAPANPTARSAELSALNTQLATITNKQVADLLAATHATAALISQPHWILDHVAGASTLPAGTVLVWATSFSQKSLPSGLNSKRSPYAALPDAYLKYANWGQISSIPSIYQAYYAPGGGTAHWSVSIANASGSRSVANVLITDVGPWNEDDNWWDPNGTSATLPASCPVSATLVAPDATSNALVNGICPNGANLRRIFYYLLYQHAGLPFFAPGGYAPSGSFADGTAWPNLLAQYCAETAAAAKNSDGVTCYTGPSGYNGTNGGWMRNGTYNAGIPNQSSIDVSPAVDKALGWVYPSSGLVQLNVSALP